MDVPRACFIGGNERYSANGIDEYVSALPRKTVVVTGSGAGAEARVKLVARKRGLKVVIPPLFDVPQATKLQIIDVYVQALRGGTLVLVGKGERVDEARAMLNRSSAWPMEVEELP